MIRILFVDDEQSVLDGLKRALRPLRKGWNAAFAGGGQKALETLQSAPFDAIVTDMRMPGMDGLTLLKLVSEQYPNLLRVVLSGQSELEEVIKAETAAHHYLAKPCPLELLQSTVSRAFSLRRLFASLGVSQLVESIDWDWRRFVLHDSSVALLFPVNVCCAVERPTPHRPRLEEIRSHRSTRSSYARRIARLLMASNGELHDQAEAAGLLLDVGQAVLRCHFRERYGAVEELALSESVPLVVAEKDAFGASHAELSAYILAQAGLVDVVVEAVAYHHSPASCPNPDSPLLLALHLADVLVLSDDLQEQSLDLKFLDSIGQATDLAEWRKVAVGTVN